MSQPTCQVCLIPYDTKDHRPLLLPACGHTFCASCLGCLQRQGKTSCPKCRKDGAVKLISSLPVNYSLLDIAEECKADAIAEPNSASPSQAAGASRQVPTPHSGLGYVDASVTPSRAAGASRQQVPTPHSGLRYFSDFPAEEQGSGIEEDDDIGELPADLDFTGYEDVLTERMSRALNSSPPRQTGTPRGQASTTHTSGHINQVKSNNHEAAIIESCPRAAGCSRLQSHQSHMKKYHLLRDFINHHPSTSQAVSLYQPMTAGENSLAAAFSRLSYNTDSPTPARTQDAHSSASSVLTALEKEEQDELDFQMAVHLTFCKDSNHDHDLHSSCSSWCWQNP